MRSRVVGAALAAVLYAAAPVAAGAPSRDGPSRAELASADAAFKEGRAAFAKKDFTAAAAAFERALAIVPHAKTAYLAGLAYDEGGDVVRAASLFERALALGGLASEQERDARARIEAIDSKTARLTIDSPSASEVRVDDGLVEAGRAIRLAPGAHVLRARFASGKETTATFRAVAGAFEVVPLTEPLDPPVPPEERLPTPPPTNLPVPAPVARPRPRAPVAKTRGPSRLPYDVAGGIAFGLSGIGLFSMIGLGEHAISVRDRFVDGGRVSEDLHDQAVASRTGANVALALSIAFGATGVVLFAVAPRAKVVVAPAQAALRFGF